jgi:putative methyltransferase (TIGR04325 family)
VAIVSFRDNDQDQPIFISWCKTSIVNLRMRIPPRISSSVRSARLMQIRRLSAALLVLHASPAFVSLLRFARSWAIPRMTFDALAGYRRVFPSLTEAGQVAARYINDSHGCADDINRQMTQGLVTRPSDYPVLFHMHKLMPEVRSLFDLGGNAGNLFYCYSKYLNLPQDFIWSVQDVAPTVEFGRRLARERGEHRLNFTEDLQAINGHDVLLASGALHYVEPSLPNLLRGLSSKPKHVIVNRTPMTTVKSVVTVQDAGTYQAACKTILRQELISGMDELGYDLVDRWSVPELFVRIPFYPEYSVPEYTGLYFRVRPPTEDASVPGASE